MDENIVPKSKTPWACMALFRAQCVGPRIILVRRTFHNDVSQHGETTLLWKKQVASATLAWHRIGTGVL
jgi:hypothetical protein